MRQGAFIFCKRVSQALQINTDTVISIISVQLHPLFLRPNIEGGQPPERQSIQKYPHMSIKIFLKLGLLLNQQAQKFNSYNLST